jgi:hypothetical protein
MAPTAEDVQGSSMFTKLAHVTLIIDACDMQEGEIYGIGGTTKTVYYDRVVTIAAARNGKGTRWRVAYTQDKEKPIFHELGLLVPIAKRKGVK